jgi:glyoxalase family protein
MKTILGLHHVTATVNQAQPDVDFCVDRLGLRLLKKTVNFDNHHVYHFYYGNEEGTPGTIWTTFPYHGRGVPTGTKGAGQITVTSFSVPAGSLGRWKARLKESGISVRDVEPRFEEESIVAEDPSGLAIELVANDHDARRAWTSSGISPETAVRGLHSVSLAIRAPVHTIEFMTGILGFEVVKEAEGRTRLAINGDEPGRIVDIVDAARAVSAANGLGTVHHVAFAVATAGEQLHMRRELLRLGHRVTEVLDRQYFQSIYFREPGGVLFEIATVQPGFTVDEPLAALGCDLKLPPWEEPNRPQIVAGLPPIVVREGRTASELRRRSARETMTER